MHALIDFSDLPVGKTRLASALSLLSQADSIAGLATHDRWAQPLLRLLDTAIGVVIGLVAALLATRIKSRVRT